MGAITKWLVGGSPATAEINGFFSFNDPTLCINHSEAAAYFQGTAFIHFENRFFMFHNSWGLILKTYFPVCPIAVGHAPGIPATAKGGHPGRF